jgi:hypothetical protein
MARGMKVLSFSAVAQHSVSFIAAQSLSISLVTQDQYTEYCLPYHDF